jgi:alpha-glucosidase
VYLPTGRWFDWWTGEAFTGPTHILAHAPLEKMPLYVRAGAIIPMAPVMQYVEEQPLTSLTIRIWVGEGEFTHYEDDGRSFEYKTGNFSTTNYRIHTQANQTIVEIGAREGDYSPTAREIIVELVGVGEQRFVDDGTAKKLTFGLGD